jgi:23S rRNA (cytidine1920-2'-O)/16S rRNA (cytidine1409-2'-O)-methyltransferase
VSRIRRSVTVLAHLRAKHAGLADPEDAIRQGRVQLGGVPLLDPAALVPANAELVVRPGPSLRGRAKLAFALDRFAVDVRGVVALDAGAAAGGFTTALLGAGAARVYAVDVGYGQLRGSLRADERVVVLERTNISRLTSDVVPEPVQLITLDLSYVSVARAVPQLAALDLRPGADLIALIKPMFELGTARLPSPDRWPEAIQRAERGVGRAGWHVQVVAKCPVVGSRGAVEFFLHARRTYADG